MKVIQFKRIGVIKMLKIGFTGTRHGMTAEQEKEIEKLVQSKDFKEFHHGMCVGSDEIAHKIVSTRTPKVKIIGHPPKAVSTKAQLRCHKEMDPDSWSRRNKSIVDSSDYLVATPDAKERVGSGTWKTIRYARKQGKRIYIIHKNGRVTIE